jgi:hypothetical protein
MEGIYITHPVMPNQQDLLEEGVQRIQVRLDESLGVFLIRKYKTLTLGGGQEDHGYTLPRKPEGSPSWSHALCLPGTMGEKTGLAFILGDQCYWTETTTSKGKAANSSNWTPMKITAEHLILASLQTNPDPHNKFWLEAIVAEQKFRDGKPLGKKTRPWPSGFHLAWLKIAMNTGFWRDPELSGCDESKPVLRIPMEGDLMDHLLGTMRRGAIISMAHRYPEELPEASEVIQETTKARPVDSTWLALLPLCSRQLELGKKKEKGQASTKKGTK